MDPRSVIQTLPGVVDARRWTVWYVTPACLAGGTLWYAGWLALRAHRAWPLYVVCALGAVGAGVGLLRARWRGLNRIRELEHEQALELERRRIAQDLHDSLGADLTRIALQAEMIRLQADPDHTLGQIGKLAAAARGLVDSLNELVWATDPSHNTLDSLAAYLREYAVELLEPTGMDIRFEIPLPLSPCPISGELRRHLFLAAKEALGNTLKHAQATEVRLGFAVSDHQVEIVVADNGRGFCPAAPRPGRPHTRRLKSVGRGNGLRNLRERLAAAGGGVQVDSAPNRGTRIRLTAPLTGVPPDVDGVRGRLRRLGRWRAWWPAADRKAP